MPRKWSCKALQFRLTGPYNQYHTQPAAHLKCRFSPDDASQCSFSPYHGVFSSDVFSIWDQLQVTIFIGLQFYCKWPIAFSILKCELNTNIFNRETKIWCALTKGHISVKLKHKRANCQIKHKTVISNGFSEYTKILIAICFLHAFSEAANCSWFWNQLNSWTGPDLKQLVFNINDQVV